MRQRLYASTPRRVGASKAKGGRDFADPQPPSTAARGLACRWRGRSASLDVLDLRVDAHALDGVAQLTHISGPEVADKPRLADVREPTCPSWASGLKTSPARSLSDLG